MSNEDGEGVSATCAVLDRHDQGRRCGVPMISVLAGPEALGVWSARRWAETMGRPMVLVRLEQPDPESMVAPWVDELAKQQDLIDAAVNWLARRLDQPAGLLGRSLRAMTSYEAGIFLESVLPLVSETGVELVSRWVIERAAAGMRPGGPALAPALDSVLEGRGPPWIRVFRAMGELIPQECLPVLVLTSAGQDLSALERTGRLLTALAAAQPHAALILLVDAGLFDTYLTQAPVSRAKALLRESVVLLTCPDRPPLAGPAATPAKSRESQSLESLACASLASGNPESAICRQNSRDLGPADDDARSAAERFLFERLESIPETAGLFELNRTLDFHFGPNRWVEVDLAARSLNLVVEVDGYHHFQDPEAFRRDRRKDLELQKHGYLVARVLAGDVVERLEDVLDTILKAVAFRRATADRP
ncbi:MAG: endonuclease domain-containing protein [Isosphaerales bacterium]